jgi:hypothetical protein
MGEECQPLDPDEVRAFWVADGLLITAQGSFPESCWEARIRESPLTIWPPEFILTRCQPETCAPKSSRRSTQRSISALALDPTKSLSMVETAVARFRWRISPRRPFAKPLRLMTHNMTRLWGCLQGFHSMRPLGTRSPSCPRRPHHIRMNWSQSRSKTQELGSEGSPVYIICTFACADWNVIQSNGPGNETTALWVVDNHEESTPLGLEQAECPRPSLDAFLRRRPTCV